MVKSQTWCEIIFSCLFSTPLVVWLWSYVANLACDVTKSINFPTKSLRSKRRILFISFQVMTDHVFLRAFDYTKKIIQSRTDKKNGSNLPSIFLWIVLASSGLASSCCLWFHHTVCGFIILFMVSSCCLWFHLVIALSLGRTSRRSSR